MYLYTVSAEFANPAMAADGCSGSRVGMPQDVLQCGASSAEVVRLDDAVTAYEVRYVFPDRETYLQYRDNHAPRLQAEGLERFPDSSGASTNDQPESSRRPFRRLDERRALK